MKVLTESIKVVLILSLLSLVGCDSTSEKKIGIIMPAEHKSMDEIVAGFKETINSLSSQPVKIKVANAQGDVEKQRAIIQKMHDEKYDIIAPIGTDATEMTLKIAKHQPLVSLAANFSQKDRMHRKPCHIAIVNDEISASKLLQFIHLAYPNITEMTLVHSNAEKVQPTVTATIAAAKPYGLNVRTVNVANINELHNIANTLPPGTQAILVLKDHFIVSNISAIAAAAEQQHIPLISSDQGSAAYGAGFALGIHERSVGVDGAKLAVAILSGQSACDLPIAEKTSLTVFVNKNRLAKENQSIEPIELAAQQQNYPVEWLD